MLTVKIFHLLQMLPFKGWDRRRSWRKQAYFDELENSNDSDDAYLDEQATTMAKRLQWRIGLYKKIVQIFFEFFIC